MTLGLENKAISEKLSTPLSTIREEQGYYKGLDMLVGYFGQITKNWD
jgi:hypothetical protein